MKKSEVIIHATYLAKVSGKLTEVRITGTHGDRGWDAINLNTDRSVWIRSAQRLRKRVLHPVEEQDAMPDIPRSATCW